MQATISAALLALLALLLLVAAVGDLRDRQIPNWLTGGIALLAIPFWISLELPVWPDIAIRLAVGIGLFILFAGLFQLGMMGGGDVKLIAALALWLPPLAVLPLLMIMAIAGGILTLVMLVHARLRRAGRPEVPYGVAIAVAGMWMIAEPIINHFA